MKMVEENGMKTVGGEWDEDGGEKWRKIIGGEWDEESWRRLG